MAFKHQIDLQSRLLITTYEGVAIDIKFIEALKIYQETIQRDPAHLGFNEVVDLTKITQIKITLKGIKTISSIAHKTDANNTRTKLAFIVNSKCAFSMVKLYKAYRSIGKSSSKEIDVFYDEEKAFDWVRPVEIQNTD